MYQKGALNYGRESSEKVFRQPVLWINLRAAASK